MVIVVVFSILAFSASAADRATKIKTLMEAQGLLQMWAQQMETARQQDREQAQQMLSQMMASLNPSPEFDARFRSVFNDYMEALKPRWTAQDLVNVWAEKYGAKFTDQELDGLLAYYTSPLGRKDIAATQAALPLFTDHFIQLSKPIAEKATQQFVQRLQLVAKQCNCRKR